MAALFSPRPHMNLRCNRAGQTADSPHTASMSYLSASESHRHCQLVVSSGCVCVRSVYLACSGAA